MWTWDGDFLCKITPSSGAGTSGKTPMQSVFSVSNTSMINPSCFINSRIEQKVETGSRDCCCLSHNTQPWRAALSEWTVANLERFLRQSKSWAIKYSCLCLHSLLQCHRSPKEGGFGRVSSFSLVLHAVHYLIWRGGRSEYEKNQIPFPLL